jgi:uncharacterized protein YjdB
MKKENNIYKVIFNLMKNGGGLLLIVGLFALSSCQQPGGSTKPETGITLTPTTAALVVGQTIQLKTTVTPHG